MSNTSGRKGRWYGNVDHRASGTRLEKLEEMQQMIVRQKHASETEWGGLQNSDQTSNVVWNRNVVGTRKRQ